MAIYLNLLKLAIQIGLVAFFFHSIQSIIAGPTLLLENNDSKKITAEILSLSEDDLVLRPVNDYRKYTIPLSSLKKESQDRINDYFNKVAANNKAPLVNLNDIIERDLSKTLPDVFRRLDNPDESLFGLKFGNSLQEVIRLLGKPNGIIVTSNGNISIIYSSYFGFYFDESDKLKEVTISRNSLIPYEINDDYKYAVGPIDKFLFMNKINLGMHLDEAEKKIDLSGNSHSKIIKELDCDAELKFYGVSDGNKNERLLYVIKIRE